MTDQIWLNIIKISVSHSLAHFDLTCYWSFLYVLQHVNYCAFSFMIILVIRGGEQHMMERSSEEWSTYHVTGSESTNSRDDECPPEKQDAASLQQCRRCWGRRGWWVWALTRDLSLLLASHHSRDLCFMITTSSPEWLCYVNKLKYNINLHYIN